MNRYTLLLLTLLGCSCGYRPQMVELSHNTFAMDPWSFHCWEFQHHLTTPEVWYGADVAGAAPPHDSMVEAAAQREGCYMRASDVIALRVADPAHLTPADRLKLMHEEAHRQDHRLFADSQGASPLWRLLATTPGGQAYLTHPEINKRLRAEGYEAP